MPNVVNDLLNLYLRLIGWTLLGVILGRILPKETSAYLGKFFFWVGVPISIVAFVRRANLNGFIWISPITAWIAILVGAAFAWIWIDLGLAEERIRTFSRGLDAKQDTKSDFPKLSFTTKAKDEGFFLLDSTPHPSPQTFQLGSFTKPSQLRQKTAWSKSTQGSFLLAMMVGNTGYLGYPVVLALVGPDYFAWAVIYDLLGSALGVYGLGVTLAAHYGTAKDYSGSIKRSVQALLHNPAMWSFGLGLLLRNLPFPPVAEQGLHLLAWTVVTLSLVLIGMKLSQLSNLHNLQQALTCLGIKMLLVPLVVGTGLMFFGVTGAPRLVLVLQMAMPPAFATVVFAEAYNLDRDLAVTTLVLGCVGLLLTLPIWLLLFGTG